MKTLIGRNSFTFVGLSFIAIGFITFLSVVGHFRTVGDIPWIFLAYASMDILLGIGFCMREKWLLPLLTLNLGGYAALHIATLLFGSSPDIVHMGVNILTAGALCGVVYIARGQLVETQWGRLQAAAFVFLWALAYVSAWTSLQII